MRRESAAPSRVAPWLLSDQQKKRAQLQLDPQGTGSSGHLQPGQLLSSLLTVLELPLRLGVCWRVPTRGAEQEGGRCGLRGSRAWIPEGRHQHSAVPHQPPRERPKRALVHFQTDHLHGGLRHLRMTLQSWMQTCQLREEQPPPQFHEEASTEEHPMLQWTVRLMP